MKIEEYIDMIVDNVPHPLQRYTHTYDGRPLHHLRTGIVWFKFLRDGRDEKRTIPVIEVRDKNFVFGIKHNGQKMSILAAAEYADKMAEIIENNWTFIFLSMDGERYFRTRIKQAKNSKELCELVVKGLEAEPRSLKWINNKIVPVPVELINKDLIAHAKALNAEKDVNRLINSWTASHRLIL